MMSDRIVPPPTLPPGTPATMPFHARHGYLPTIGSALTVTLGGDRGTGTGGEAVRGTVEEIVSKDIVLVRAAGLVTRSAEHGFRAGDLVPVQRGKSALGTEIWVPIDDREVREQEARDRAQLAASRAQSRYAEEAAAAAQRAAEAEENL